MEAPKQESISVKGRFVREIHCSPDQFVIGVYELVQWRDPVPPDVERNMEFIALGPLLPRNNVFNINFKGRWVNNPKRDGEKQLSVNTYELEMPVTREGILKVLSSGLYRGIGPRTAEKIYNIFGAESLDVVTHQTYLLKQVDGIGPATIQYISESVRESVDLMELIAFLAVYEISLWKIKQIQKEFPVEPKKVIEHEPFKLCQVKGFSFEDVDAIAQRLNTPLASSLRIQAALEHVMLKSNRGGHLYTYRHVLLKSALRLLNNRALPTQLVSLNAVLAELQVLEMDGKIVAAYDKEGNEIIYRQDDYRDEEIAARRLYELMETRMDIRRMITDATLEREIGLAEQIFQLTLSPRQREAVKLSLTENVCVITGGPGTGKTTILRFILHIYERIVDNGYVNAEERPTVLLMAPTGKAARRMSETSGREAYTAHKALGLNPGTMRSDMGDSMIKDNVGRVFLDEASMADMSLTARLLEQLPNDCQLTFLGDCDQLPSVGPGSVLADLISSHSIPVIQLDVIYRQGETSLIVTNAHKIRTGDTNLVYRKSSFAFFPTDEDNDAAAEDLLIDLYLRAAKAYGYHDAMILCPRRDTVAASAASFNKKVQQRLFGGSNVQKVRIGGTTYHVGERVIQTKNTTKAHNGDTGTINDIRADPGQSGGFIASIHFDFMEPGNTVEYYPEDFDFVKLGYAITVHRSQGSEYKAVFIPVLYSQKRMMYRNLLYTGVTRGKSVVVLAGQKDAINKAILTDNTRKRNSLYWVRVQDLACA